MDFDEGFGAVTLDLTDGSSASVTEADIMRGYDEFAVALDQLHERLDSRPELRGDGRTATRSELRYWHEVGALIRRHLGVCTPTISKTVEAELGTDQAWLDRTRRHYE
jgi:hypothetical protein